ncbi:MULTISPECIES: DMT family transporter [Acinetobacter]|jgi:drug/metabolite transporter (DMT)-like permease|uniref:DMT family transporter n=2 Tax=Acinetobacter TaxID=469 RepID=A0A4Q7B2B1_9GAMM|nr:MULTISPECIES: DMT family transporter [Acinetobacter]MCW8039197.1 DMT family transporter [Acinetobacter entericus]RZG67205.1 DMT family transporter [Acinetobacter bouvetii]TCB73619.1 DMT family transporter [Acinetobacter sp. ANC 4177]
MQHNPKMMRWAVLLPLLSVFIWSLNIAVTRYVTEYISPVSISFYRWLVAFIMLTPFMLPQLYKNRALIQQHWKQLAVLAAFGMVLYQGLSYSAAHYTTATNMGIINAFIPVFTILVSVFILKEWPNRFALLGCLISFSGLLLVIAKGHWANLLSLGGHAGDAIMLAAVFFYAFYGVLLKKWQLKIPLFISVYVQIFFALLYHLPFVLYLGLDAINAQNVWSVLYAGMFPSLAAPLLWMLSIQYLGPNQTSVFMNLMPIVTAAIAYCWLAEQWTVYHSIGTALAILGVLLAQKKLPARVKSTTE